MSTKALLNKPANEPGEEDFGHITDDNGKTSLCGRRLHKDTAAVGTAIYTPMHEDVCSKCVKIYDEEFVLVRRRRS